MPTFIRTLPLIALLSMGSALWAQETETSEAEPAQTEETAQEAQPEAPAEPSNPEAGLDLGREVTNDEEAYIKETYGDWQLQCFRSEAGEDPCQMYQLLREDAGNPVAEFTIFKLPGNGQAVAGATIVVPLGTLLTEGLKLSVDGGTVKGYSYSFCSLVGCFARIGFTEQDIASFRAGVAATLTLTPAQAPDQQVVINASLSGFTAAYNEVSVAGTQN
ncbi:invasion associated locus B family protein [Roseovarius rhodophyticola]|uniref:Invasion associated locus B family protein n=1 Tax=Roseovarius rhodophyticola TaxID=3080827 RepID=A0ABZ2TE14_9RHOB|nr:invasion associated locus B family protein [Roseovarius sp. W115]MDV2928153.1 invasion associated locus B family protein [Roseovarius sp. W115]